ncbi:hypothetical protein Tco_0222966 [Tanacetum coccineum]
MNVDLIGKIKAYLADDSFPYQEIVIPSSLLSSLLLPSFHNSLSGKLASITIPPGNDNLSFDAESDLLELEYLLNHDLIKDMDSILKDSVDKNFLDDTISKMFTDERECS